MIKIYCLVNPFSGLPFYVGATRRPLLDRLKSHIVDRFAEADDLSKMRNQLIRDIIINGSKPLIYCLIIVSPDVVDIFEKEYYALFSSQGIELLQHKHRFTYQEHYCKNKSNK